MSKSTRQYAAHCAATGARDPGKVQGVTFRDARTGPPPAQSRELLMRAAELRTQARRMMREADQLELAAGLSSQNERLRAVEG